MLPSLGATMSAIAARRRDTGSWPFAGRRLVAGVRWVLAFFVLSLGIAALAPCVQPVLVQFVCSSAGPVKLLVKVDGNVHEMGDGHLDCALCLPGGAPPATSIATFVAPSLQPIGRILQSIPAARLAGMVAAPLPPRGPPEVI